MTSWRGEREVFGPLGSVTKSKFPFVVFFAGASGTFPGGVHAGASDTAGDELSSLK